MRVPFRGKIRRRGGRHCFLRAFLNLLAPQKVKNKMENQKSLDRYLSRLNVWAIAFGCMVGWGAFAMPGTTFLPVAGPAGSLISLGLAITKRIVDLMATLKDILGRKQ